MNIEIPKANSFENRVFSIENEKEFLQIALELFNFQYLNNPVYHSFCKALHKHPDTIKKVEEIPFLPISFFKTHEVKTTVFEPEVLFKSSGTTSLNTSKHLVKHASVYEKSFTNSFINVFGNPNDFCIIGLLPSYLEQGNSSLVYMVDTLIKNSAHPQSGFFLYDFEKLQEVLVHLELNGQPTILFGVTYALLDFAHQYPRALKNVSIVETGGMKGRRKEISKSELYHQLQHAFSLEKIYSEYGMTELLSQAYGVNGAYTSPPWMKILLRDQTDPFSLIENRGAINVIDLANIYSCCFIATDDLGKKNNDGSFEVLGRLDNSDIRGCSQMIS